MANVTQSLLQYLDAAQHIWNAYFLEKFGSIYECEPLDIFEEIDRLLFRALVCQPLKLSLPEDFRFRSDAVPELMVKAKEGVSELEMYVSKSSTDGNKYWEVPTSYSTESMKLSFIEFFQWNKYDFLSSSAIRCKVENLNGDMAFRHRQVIIESRFVEIFCVSGTMAD